MTRCLPYAPWCKYQLTRQQRKSRLWSLKATGFSPVRKSVFGVGLGKAAFLFGENCMREYMAGNLADCFLVARFAVEKEKRVP